MKQTFELQPTPRVARRLVRLSDVLPNMVIDPAIAEMAKLDIIGPEVLDDFPEMTPGALALIRDFIDSDMRAIVGMSGQFNSYPRAWLYPALAAARLEGITDIVFSTDDHRIAIESARQFGYDHEHVHFHDHTEVLEENSVPRDALLIIVTETALLGHPPGIIEFYRTIVFTPTRLAKRVNMFPGMPNLSSIYGMSPEALGSRGFTKLTITSSAFLFNVIFLAKMDDN